MNYWTGFFTGLAMVVVVDVMYFDKEHYKQGFEAGKQYEKQRRTAWADSIRNNNKWNNGVPDSVREDFKWE